MAKKKATQQGATKFTYVILHEAANGTQAVVATATTAKKADQHLKDLEERKVKALEATRKPNPGKFVIVPVLLVG